MVRFGRCVLPAILFLLPVATYAEGEGLVVSPPFQEVIIQPTDQLKKISLTLTNRTATGQAVDLSGVDFKSLDETGGVAFLGQDANELERKYGLAKWLSLDSSSLEVKAGESKKVTATIQNRSDLGPGGHYGAILFRVVGEGPSGANTVAVKQVFASLMFVKKVGGERYGLELDKLDKPSDWLKPNQEVRLNFKNTGNVHLVPRGTIEILAPSGKLVAKANINPESGIILPESVRKYNSKLSYLSTLKPGRYNLSISYRYEGSEEVKKVVEPIYIWDLRFVAIMVAIGISAAVLVFLVVRAIWGRTKRLAKKRAN